MKKKVEKNEYSIPNHHKKPRRKSLAQPFLPLHQHAYSYRIHHHHYTHIPLQNPHIPSPQPTALTKPAALRFCLSDMRKIEPPRTPRPDHPVGVGDSAGWHVVPVWPFCVYVHHRYASPLPPSPSSLSSLDLLPPHHVGRLTLRLCARHHPYRRNFHQRRREGQILSGGRLYSFPLCVQFSLAS